MPIRYRKLRYRRTRRYSSKRRKYTLRSAKRKLMPWKNPRKEEVKYITISAKDQALKILYNGAGTLTELTGVSNYQSNLLQYITQGTNYDDRIGNSVFLKSISYKFMVWGCPTAVSGANSNINEFLLRIVVHDGNIAPASPIPEFFSAGVARPGIGFINRKNFNVYYDKTYRISTGFYTSSLTSTNYNLTGPIKFIQFTVPVNRIVTFRNDNASPKECRDFFSMAAIVSTPGMATATNLSQVACMDYQIRAYFTDA